MVSHLKCTVKAVYINLLEAKRGVRANPLELSLPTGLGVYTVIYGILP